MVYARYALSVVLVLIIIGSANAGYTYEPLTFVPEKDIPKAETVFVGRVVQLTEKFRGDWGSDAEAKIEILGVFKGLGLKPGEFIYIGYRPFIPCDVPDPCIEADFQLGTEVLFVIKDYIAGDTHDFDVFFHGGIDFALEVNDGGHRSDLFQRAAQDEPIKFDGLNCWATDLKLSKEGLRKLAAMKVE